MRRERGRGKESVGHPSFPHVPAAVTHTVTSPPQLTQAILERMSRKIGRIGDWNNNSQSGSDRFMSRSRLFKTTSDTNCNLRNGSSGPRIATLRDSTQPDPPARHHVSDDEDEEESGRDQGESWFAGGERRLVLIVSLTSVIYLIRHLQVGYR